VSFVNGNLGGVVRQDSSILMDHSIKEEVVEVARSCRWGPDCRPDWLVAGSCENSDWFETFSRRL